MNKPARPIMLAADHISDLTRTFTTTEIITQPTRGTDGRWRTTTYRHTIRHPPLLTQITTTITGSTTSGEIYHAAYGSKPAGRIDCLAFLERLDRQSRTMADAHGINTLPLTARLQALSGIIGDKPNPRVRAWWTTARILTQHDGPPFTPDVPCPNERCDQRGTLRCRVEDKIAVCTECQDTWSDEDDDPTRSFGRLAVWVKWASEHLRGIRHWVTDDDITGYRDLGYQVECPDCAPERVAMATREAARLLAVRPRREPPLPRQLIAS